MKRLLPLLLLPLLLTSCSNPDTSGGVTLSRGGGDDANEFPNGSCEGQGVNEISSNRTGCGWVSGEINDIVAEHCWGSPNDCKIAEPALNKQIPEVRENPPKRGGIKINLRVTPEDWSVPDHSFFQTNFFILPKMVDQVRKIFKSNDSEYLIDTYCGVGFFAIELANLTKQFIGVESDKLAIKAAQENAIKFGATNGEFIDGRTEDLLPELLKKFSPNKTSVILDPPRKGCAPSAIEQLRKVKPSQIIYISCHPATLARDLNILCSEGVYKLERVYPIDMFPHTQHIECIIDLRLN